MRLGDATARRAQLAALSEPGGETGRSVRSTLAL